MTGGGKGCRVVWVERVLVSSVSQQGVMLQRERVWLIKRYLLLWFYRLALGISIDPCGKSNQDVSLQQ